jgi:hypothetical protein
VLSGVRELRVVGSFSNQIRDYVILAVLDARVGDRIDARINITQRSLAVAKSAKPSTLAPVAVSPSHHLSAPSGWIVSSFPRFRV